MAPPRLAIIEDDPRYRATLEQLFAQAGTFHVAGSFASPPAALAELERSIHERNAAPWDIVVMDLEMPRMNGIEATRQVKAVAPSIKVVVLTVFEDPAAILEAVCAGADGYMLKKARARELLDGLRTVMDGGSPLTSGVA